jgi:dTDP-4-dehydrorhamnose 3,5-epimerase-like enzyme
MIFNETVLAGAFIIELERREDDRGFFARTFCQKEFADHGLKTTIAQANTAFSAIRGTLRGMHFQYPPAAETKLVRCTRGSILESSTFGRRARHTFRTSRWSSPPTTTARCTSPSGLATAIRC